MNKKQDSNNELEAFVFFDSINNLEHLNSFYVQIREYPAALINQLVTTYSISKKSVT